MSSWKEVKKQSKAAGRSLIAHSKTSTQPLMQELWARNRRKLQINITRLGVRQKVLGFTQRIASKNVARNKQINKFRIVFFTRDDE